MNSSCANISMQSYQNSDAAFFVIAIVRQYKQTIGENEKKNVRVCKQNGVIKTQCRITANGYFWINAFVND